MKGNESRGVPGAEAVEGSDEPTHSEDGVDLILIRWMLSLTPAQRFQMLQENVRAIIELRGDKGEV